MIKSASSGFCWLYCNFKLWNVTDGGAGWVFSSTKNSFFSSPPPRRHRLPDCHTTVTPVTPSLCRCTPNHMALLSFLLLLLLFFYSSLFHLSSFPLLYFCLSPGWLKWVSRRSCCVVFDSSLGAKLSLTRLLGPTVFLKSVSINIIMACSRHHWIFYCNVQQNITPTLGATQKVSLSDRNFLILTERSLRGLFHPQKFLCFCCVFFFVLQEKCEAPVW